MCLQDAVLEHQQAPAHSIEKVAIVADHDEGSCIAVERVFQGFARRNVQVVGRFVEGQHVARKQQHLGQRQTTALAAREAAHGAEGIVAEKTELGQILAHHFGRKIAAHRLDFLDGGALFGE